MSTSAAPLSTVDEILRFNQPRKRALLRIKFARMAENVFAFFRGTDHLFASHWPALHPDEVGPAILICGDLHLENFGAYQTDDRDFRYDINDFDEVHYRMREMVPDENRSKLDRLQNKPEMLRLAVCVVGRVTAWSQLRGCRSGPSDVERRLTAWVDSPALDAVLSAAVRYADITSRDFQTFYEAYSNHHFEKLLRE